VAVPDSPAIKIKHPDNTAKNREHQIYRPDWLCQLCPDGAVKQYSIYQQNPCQFVTKKLPPAHFRNPIFKIHQNTSFFTHF